MLFTTKCFQNSCRSDACSVSARPDLVEYIAANYTRRAELLSTQRTHISPGLPGTAGNVAWSLLHSCADLTSIQVAVLMLFCMPCAWTTNCTWIECTSRRGLHSTGINIMVTSTQNSTKHKEFIIEFSNHQICNLNKITSVKLRHQIRRHYRCSVTTSKHTVWIQIKWASVSRSTQQANEELRLNFYWFN